MIIGIAFSYSAFDVTLRSHAFPFILPDYKQKLAPFIKYFKLANLIKHCKFGLVRSVERDLGESGRVLRVSSQQNVALAKTRFGPLVERYVRRRNFYCRQPRSSGKFLNAIRLKS